LRGFLRQDCDIILVGEIRDPETASLAVQASLTGHLVLGTLHTNSAIGAVSRLSEMGIPSFLIANAVIGVVSQRLLRRLCRTCRRPYQPSAEQQTALGLRPEHVFYSATACDDCAGFGFRGRIGIQEVLPITPELRESIGRAAPEQDLQRMAVQAGMTPIFRDGLAKAVLGITTIEEVYAAVLAE